jgi:probable O-glycosylation ligase (exosortase A-associated)
MLRSLLVAGIIFALLPYCFFRPWIGILLWTWISYMSPHRLAYGFAYDFPFALIVSVVTLAGLLASKERGRIPRTAETALLGALWLVFFLSTFLSAFYPEAAWAQFNKVSKILLMTFVTAMLIQSKERLFALFSVVCFSLGFFGFKGGVWSILSGGGAADSQVLGPSGTFLGGNTEIGLAMNMNLPILLYLRRHVKRRWLRLLMLATFFLSIAAIIATYSRGALLGLLAVVGFLTIVSKARAWGIALLVIGIPLVLTFAPERWIGRMETIQTYEEDASAMGRIHMWILSMRIAADRPFLGGGFRCMTEEITLRYFPESPDRGFDAHNIFFQVLAEHGVTGLLLYVGLILTTFGTLVRIQRRTRGSPDLVWLSDLAQMVQGSLIAYVVSGFFLSLSYFDLFFLLVATTAAMRVILNAELSRQRAAA